MNTLTVRASLARIQLDTQRHTPPGHTLRRIIRFCNVKNEDEFALIQKIKEAFEAGTPIDQILAAVKATLEFFARAEKA